MSGDEPAAARDSLPSVELEGLRRIRLRELPAVDALVRALDEGNDRIPHARRVEAARLTLAAARRRLAAVTSAEALAATPVGQTVLLAEARRRLVEAMAWHLDHVVNATGIVLHTNLGRAPLSVAALARVSLVGGRYTNLELDVRTKSRGSRYDHVDAQLCRLTGAEASLVVNNNAAAVLLALDTLARGKEVVVSRGEMIEIGGSFRIPDIMLRSGARLVEVGTTNRTRLADYATAIGPETGLLLKVHPSNYRVRGFTESVGTADLAGLAHARGLPVMEDLGSGCLVDLRALGLTAEPTVAETVRAGIDLVTFSGDKLLGGPQAGLAVGSRLVIERLRRNPLARALRIDKLTLAALEATLRAYEDPEAARWEIPTLRMLAEPEAEIRRRAARCVRRLPAAIRSALGARVVRGISQVGGGALPLVELPTAAVALGSPAWSADALDAGLRARRPPIIGRVAHDQLLLDCRTVADEEVPVIAAALEALVGPGSR